MGAQSNNTISSFNNTTIAFKNLSNKELKRAYYLFMMFNYNRLVQFGSFATLKAIEMGLPIQSIIKKTIFEHFCAGETIAEAKTVVEKLEEFKVHSVLDYGVEAKATEEEFDNTKNHLIAKIEYAKEEPYLNIVSSKLTALFNFDLLEKVSAGIPLMVEEQKIYKKGEKRIEAIAKAAEKANIKIFIDAEEGWIQNAVDEIVTELMQKHNKKQPIIYNTIQLYRHDRLQFLKDAYEKANTNGYQLAVKLVRGAYMEKERARAAQFDYEDPIQPNKVATDRDFDLALSFCVEHCNEIAMCCASHNAESTSYLTKLIEDCNLPNDNPAISFAQLYGMSDHLTFNLANAGFCTMKYLIYGPVNDVIPYLIRRAQENSSTDGQWSREYSLIKKEMKRRGLFYL